ncbi:hypothetical protein D3C79_1114270 [compost metagenome]
MTGQAQRLASYTFWELQREDAQTSQVGAVDALEALGHDNAHAQQARAFGRPVT